MSAPTKLKIRPYARLLAMLGDQLTNNSTRSVMRRIKAAVE